MTYESQSQLESFTNSWCSYQVTDMAQQNEGWPLGLQPVNARIGLAINRDSASTSFNTLLTSSPTCSSDSSSDLDTESTGSFFHDKSITLGSLIGVSTIVELSRRSLRARKREGVKSRKINKSRTWLFALCSRDSTDGENVESAPSLGHFLAAERRAAGSEHRRNHSQDVWGADDYTSSQNAAETNSLFNVDGSVAPPPLLCPSNGNKHHRRVNHGNEYRSLPVLCSCIFGQPSCG